MEEVYVVKVKTRPEPSKLYPSERRYSAVTVGGLGLVHALLAVTSLLLAGLGIAAEGVAASYGAGIALGVAGCGAAVVGVLAWRRWYVDNNIRYFLVTSTISGLAAIISIVLTAVVIATIEEELSSQRLALRYKTVDMPVHLPLVASDPGYREGGDSELRYQGGSDAMYPDGSDESYDDLHSNNTELIEKFILAFENQKNRTNFKDIPLNETFHLRLDEHDRPVVEEETQTVQNNDMSLIDSNMKDFEQKKQDADEEMRQDSSSTMNDEDNRLDPSPETNEDVIPSVRFNHNERIVQDTNSEVRNVLSINILIASFLELAWSLLSIRIAWKGVKNDYPNDDNTNGRVVTGSERSKHKTETNYLPKFMKSVKTKERGRSMIRRPDIISNHQSQPRGVGKRVGVSVVSDEVEHYLPQQESTTEYHERVRRFLASNNENAC